MNVHTSALAALYLLAAVALAFDRPCEFALTTPSRLIEAIGTADVERPSLMQYLIVRLDCPASPGQGDVTITRVNPGGKIHRLRVSFDADHATHLSEERSAPDQIPVVVRDYDLLAAHPEDETRYITEITAVVEFIKGVGCDAKGEAARVLNRAINTNLENIERQLGHPAFDQKEMK